MSAYGLYAIYIRQTGFRHGPLPLRPFHLTLFICVPDPFNEHIHMVRPHNGQVLCGNENAGMAVWQRYPPYPKTGSGSVFIPLHTTGTWGEYGQHRIHTICFSSAR